MTNDELLHKWVNGTLTAEERAAFEERPEYTDLVKVYQHTEHLLPPSFDVEKSLSKVLTEEKAASARIVMIRRWVSFAVAAGVALLVMIFFQNQLSDAPDWVARTDIGQQTQGALPDLSTYQLNAGSRIAFDADSWEEARSVTLEGEAYFSVQKGETFTVNTAHGAVTVLGTRFNVRDRDGVLDVSCLNGKVRVLDEKGQEQAVLKAQEAVRLENGQVNLRAISEAQRPAWIQGTTILEDVPLQVVVRELERQYDIQIELTGAFKKQIKDVKFPNDDLTTALNVISPLYRLNITSTSTHTYTIRQK